MLSLKIAEEAAELSDRLNNRLTAIALKADILAAQSEGAIRDGLRLIAEHAMDAAGETRALQKISEAYLAVQKQQNAPSRKVVTQWRTGEEAQ